MIDLLSSAADALAHHDALRLPLVFAAGTLTSIGPCVAPRYVAVAALLDGSARRIPTVAAFVTGLLLAYSVLGFGVGFAAALWAQATLVYALLSLGLCASGLAVLLRRPRAHRHADRMPVRSSAAFSLGASSALIVSPCCTPFVAAIAGSAAFDRAPLVSALLLLTFALGHALPLIVLGIAGPLVTHGFASSKFGAAYGTISGSLMLALGGYYGVLA